MHQVRDVRIIQSKSLVTPAELFSEFPLDETTNEFIWQSRTTIEAILSGKDPRLLAIAGPCSVHDPNALMEFADRFREGMASLTDTIFPVLRVYFEKPRSVTGWKGLINDPDLDDSFDIDKGLRLARKTLVDVAKLAIPAATEFLDTTFGQYYADLISFGAIGARTVESQVHRELASGLSMPVGFKNGTHGDIGPAVDAIRSAGHSHWFPTLTSDGLPAILKSKGNEHSYLILRGGKDTGPNYFPTHIHQATEALRSHGLKESIIVDCSHGNSEKEHERQVQVLENIGSQIASGQEAIRGIMMESHLVPGQQPITPNLIYGQSITDACLGLEDTLSALGLLANAAASNHSS